jgi:hypothetical protein
MISRLIFLIVFLYPFTNWASKTYPRMPLNAQLKAELNNVLKAASEMHGAFFEQNEQKIEQSVEQVLVSIEQANRKTSLAEGQRPHLQKMLDSTRNQMNSLRNSSGPDRTESLKGAMEQLVLIARTYDLDRYKIFFCPKDRSVWLQKAVKAQNPIHPKLYASCGKLVQ